MQLSTKNLKIQTVNSAEDSDAIKFSLGIESSLKVLEQCIFSNTDMSLYSNANLDEVFT